MGFKRHYNPAILLSPSSRSRPNAVCSDLTVFLSADLESETDTLISLVDIIWMLMLFSANVWKHEAGNPA